jgi:hypothetical protein
VSDATWENNGIQFPRLLAEVYGVLTHEQVGSLAENMDLAPHEVCQLFERADAQWQALKDVTDASGFHPRPDTPITVTMPAWVAVVAHEVLVEEYNALADMQEDAEDVGAELARLEALDEVTDLLADVIPEDLDERERLVEEREAIESAP